MRATTHQVHHPCLVAGGQRVEQVGEHDTDSSFRERLQAWADDLQGSSGGEAL